MMMMMMLLLLYWNPFDSSISIAIRPHHFINILCSKFKYHVAALSLSLNSLPLSMRMRACGRGCMVMWLSIWMIRIRSENKSELKKSRFTKGRLQNHWDLNIKDLKRVFLLTIVEKKSYFERICVRACECASNRILFEREANKAPGYTI